METGDSFKTVLRYILQRWFCGIGSIAVSAVVVLPYPPIALSAEPDIGSITAARGTVVLKRPGAERSVAVREGLTFKVGDVVETGASSTAQMTLTDDSFVNLGPGSAVRVNQYALDTTTDRRTTVIRVIQGKTRIVIYKLRSQGSSFRVETGNALVTTGAFADLVVLTTPGRTEVAVMDQGIVVRNSLPYIIGDVRVGVNQGTIVREKFPPSAPEVITPQEWKNWLKDLKQM
jgi:ferric-dicitrate binding protein FerR (iron transport regulator)